MMWGFSPAYPVGPWCKILLLAEVKHPNSSTSNTTALSRVIEKVRSNDPRTRLRLDPAMGSKSKCDIRTFDWGLRVTSKISIITFLDRHALELDLEVQKFDGTGVEKR